MSPEQFGTIQLRIGLTISVGVWLTGFALRLMFDREKASIANSSAVPGYRHIRVPGAFRWLFGYMPHSGPVSVAGFVLQLPALLTLATTIALTLLWPTLEYTPLISLVVLAVTMLIAIRIADRIWRSQNRNTGKK